MTQVSGESQRCLARCLMGMCIIILLSTALMSTSCAPSGSTLDDGTNRMSADSSLLSQGYRSLNDLGRAAVQALNDTSADELAQLMVTEPEFRDVIFARTPDSLKAGLPWNEAWLMNVSDSHLAIRRKLESLGGQNLRFIRTFVGDSTATTVFPGKTTYRNVIIVAEKPDDGQQIQFRFMNVVAMVGGRCKVVAFHK